MEDLIALCQLINTQRVDSIDTFDKRKRKGKTWKLFDDIINGNITNDDEGLTLLYGEGGSKHDYNRLKKRLEGKLVNNCLFLENESKQRSEMRKARYSVARDFSLINILIDRHEKRTSIKIAIRAYNKAIKYELTEYAIMIARKLYEYYGYSSPSKKKMLKYQSEIDDLQKILEAELIAEKYYTKFSHLYATKKSKFTSNHLKEIKSYVEHLLKLKTFIKSFKFNLDSYNVITSYFIFIDEYDKAIQYCEEALQFFESKPYEDKTTKWAFHNSLILAFIGKRKYVEAEEYTARNFKIVKKGTYNW